VKYFRHIFFLLIILERAKRLKYYEDAKMKLTLLEAQVCAEKGKTDEAIERCLQCIEFEPEEKFNSEVRFMLTNLYLTQSDFEHALQQATAIVVQNEQNSFYYASLYFRPYCLRKLEREEDARYYYAEAISLYRLATLKNPEAIDAYI
jgi:tetratricopeptide (TPR) repeat protein